MKKYRSAFSVLLVAVLCVGCPGRGGSKDVAEASAMVTSMLYTLEHNTETVVNDLTLDIADAYEQAIRLRIAAEREKLKDSAGRVNADEYDALLMEASDKSAENEAYIKAKKAQYLATMKRQFALAHQLAGAINRYESASGINPEGVQSFFDASLDLATEIQDLREQAEEADRVGDQEKKAKKQAEISRLLKLLSGGKNSVGPKPE